MRRVLFLIIVVLVGLTLQNPVKALLRSGQLSVQLEVEVNDGPANDASYFADDGKTVEHGRLIDYRITVENGTDRTFKNLTVKMDVPQYTAYIAGSTFMPEGLQYLGDQNNHGPLQKGIVIDFLAPGETWQVQWRAQTNMDESLVNERLATLAWAYVYDNYTALPLMSSTVETIIEGLPRPTLLINVQPQPPAGTQVQSGQSIYYNYQIENVGGVSAEQVRFLPSVPPHTSCNPACTSQLLPAIESGGLESVSMVVQVGNVPETDPYVRHQPTHIQMNSYPEVIVDPDIAHPLQGFQSDDPTGAFRVELSQKPNTILNSADGNPRPDQADRTQSLYDIYYDGRSRKVLADIQNDYKANPVRYGTTPCIEYYSYPPGTYFYTYNTNDFSTGKCQGASPQDAMKPGCQVRPSHTPLQLTINTTLPAGAPKLEWIPGADQTNYEHFIDSLTNLNAFMGKGGTFNVSPPIDSPFHTSRATENGAQGIVSTSVELTVTEDLWQYLPDNANSRICTVHHGLTTSQYTMQGYSWQKVNGHSIPITLSDTDETNITVYTSTAWLKTEGGHVATNDTLSNNQNPANRVDLGSEPFRNHYTASDTYTPPGEFNADYMIFGKNGTGSMESKGGESWKQTGTDWIPFNHGQAYHRPQNPRDFKTDLIEKQLYGPVKTDQLATVLTGTIQLEDDVVWHQKGDLVIGRPGLNETVTFAGGQARIYVDGTVTINANIKYATSSAEHYNQITSVRIDAENIVIDGDVEDIESFLMARTQLRSGISKKQLRILGDVIAGSVLWERQPLEQISPETFNDPSEHIIEDPRKYIIPPPGDTELPDAEHWWRQE